MRVIRKSFGPFVGRRTKGKKKGIVALRNSAGVSVTSTKGKLEELKTHYRHIGSYSVDSAFEDTVEPPKRGHFGNGTFVLSSEVVLFSEVV